jgi:hypothetical protein
MDNHSTVNYDVPDRCPKCGRKLNQGEAVTLEPDPLEARKAKAYHPRCYDYSNQDFFYPAPGRW